MFTLSDTDSLTWSDATGKPGHDATEVLVTIARYPGMYRLAPGLLSTDERERSRQFRFAVDRNRFLDAHTLKRYLLGAVLDVPAVQLRFENRWAGKPQLVGYKLQFNLSHSGDWVALAISHSAPVGVDIERADTMLAAGMMPIAQHPDDHLVPEPDSSVERFYTTWTLKEAFSKGVGIGLALPFTQLRLEPGTTAQYRCRYGDEVWHAEHLKLAERVHLAVACPSPWKRLRLLRIEGGT